jgi:hypothetical protein
LNCTLGICQERANVFEGDVPWVLTSYWYNCKL